MRDLLYLSRDKLDGIHVPLRRFPFARRELELTALGAGIRVGPALDGASEAQVTEKLGKVAKDLGKKAKEASDPSLCVGEWFYFDQALHYGAVASEVGRSGCGFFFQSEAVSGRNGFILCGTARNLTDRVAEVGESNALRYSGLPAVTSFLRAWVSLNARGYEEEPVGFDFFRRANGPVTPRTRCRVAHLAAQTLEGLQRGHWHREEVVFSSARLSGLARVLSVCPSDCPTPKIILGTPLYVEFGPWNPKW